MSKKYAIFITCLFVVFLGLFFVVNAVSPDKEFSPMENRVLAQAPTLSMGTAGSAFRDGNFFNGGFMSDFESYVTDQFTLRDQWIALKARSEAAMGKLENNGVYLGQSDTLISRFDTPNQTLVDRNFGLVDKLTQVTDVPVYFALIPGKVSVWADRLPAGAPNADESIFLARGAQSKAAWIDLNTNITAHKDEDIYFRTDHHWSTLGAYYGYEALMKGMGLTPKALSDFDKVTVTNEFFGTTFSNSGVRWVKPDYIDLYVPESAATVYNFNDMTHMDNGRPVMNADSQAPMYFTEKLSEKDKYSMFMGGNKPLTVLKSNVAAAGAPKLLVVRDSFSDAMAPFLAYNFSEVHLFDPRYFKVPAAQYVKDSGIDQVLVLYSVDNFVSDGNLFILAAPAQ